VAPEALIALGQIVNTHATHGELRVRLFNPDSTTLAPGATVVLRRAAEQQKRRIVAMRPHKRLLLMTFEDCDSLTAAESLVGFDVCVREDELPPAGPQEIYHYHLVGMTVITTTGAEIGVITDVIPLGSSDVCVVRGAAGEHLIPLIGDVVRSVDREAKQLVIDPLPGLLDP
jgi:16S rRNA processing protein RimM